MKTDILNLLKAEANTKGFTSGEELSRQMGVSRTAVWKHIKMLRQEGYHIDSMPRLGYRLVETPDKIYPQEIYPLLNTKVFGGQIRHFEQVASTNDTLKKIADQGAPEGMVVLSEQQTAGKGRLGRNWFSYPGTGIWCSVLLRPGIMPQDAPKLTLLGAVAVVEGIENYCGVRAGIKWPNDLLLGGKKLCGLLTEMRSELDRVDYVVLGMGINIKPESVPAELKHKATSLVNDLGRDVNRAKLLASILDALESNYQCFLGHGFQAIREKWQEYNITLGNKVTVTSALDSVSGTAVRLGAGGGLVVCTDEGVEQEFFAGEVSLNKR